MTLVSQHAIFVSFVMPAPLSFILLVNFSLSVIVYETLVILVHAHVLLVLHLTRLPHHLHVWHIHLSWRLLHHVHMHRNASCQLHAIVHLILVVHSLRLFKSIIRYTVYTTRMKID